MREIILNFQTLRNSLSALIDKSGYRNAYIADKIGMAPNHFYTKKQRNKWTEEDIEKVLNVIETEELEDYFLGRLMDSVKQDETVTLAELKEEMQWK